MQNRRSLIALLGATALAGCGPRGHFSLAPPAFDGTNLQNIYVATTRAADPAPIAYGAGRSDVLGFARLVVSIPPDHETGKIEWPKGKETDPAHDFALIGVEPFPDINAFSNAARSPANVPDAETVLFVHGYNNTFAEGVYRHAQIAWDYGLKGPQVHFAWPSAADPSEYLYDRDSVLIGRDALATLILRLLKDRKRRLAVVGHSMGGFLVMEAIRQIALQNGRSILDRLAGVTLISPDISIDLFRMQAKSLEQLPQPFVVAVSRDDSLLRFAAWLSGGQERLGTIEDLAQLEGLDVHVLDLTNMEDEGSNHFLPGTSAATIGLIKGLRGTDSPPVSDLVLGPVRITLGGTG